MRLGNDKQQVHARLIFKKSKLPLKSRQTIDSLHRRHGLPGVPEED